MDEKIRQLSELTLTDGTGAASFVPANADDILYSVIYSPLQPVCFSLSKGL